MQPLEFPSVLDAAKTKAQNKPYCVHNSDSGAQISDYPGPGTFVRSLSAFLESLRNNSHLFHFNFLAAKSIYTVHNQGIQLSAAA